MGYNLYINGTRTDTRNNKTISSVVINNTTYAIDPIPVATFRGIGSSAVASNVITTNSSFMNMIDNFEQVTINGNYFVKIPTFYRKDITITSNQLVDYNVSPVKIDNDYLPYPCFVKEDGVTVMDYILVGKYMSSSSSVMNSDGSARVSQTISNGRTKARALGEGYQLYDWQIHRLIQDLICAKLQTINTNSGSGFTTMLGIDHWENTFWIDGVASPSSGNYWVFSYKPSKYVDSPSSSTTGYQAASYTRPTSNGNIQKLGCYINHRFFNYPSSASGSTYTSYYCDQYYYNSGSRPVVCVVGVASANRGVFYCAADNAWSDTHGVRLCYRPIE